jgi:G3E family GTPase
LVDELLLVFELVLVVSGFLGCGDSSLVREAEEHAECES